MALVVGLTFARFWLLMVLVDLAYQGRSARAVPFDVVRGLEGWGYGERPVLVATHPDSNHTTECADPACDWLYGSSTSISAFGA